MTATQMRVFVTYRVTRDLAEDDASLDVACLSPEERTRAGTFAFPHDRRDYIAAHILLRHALSTVERRDPATWVFVRSPSGKPRLADDDPAHGKVAFNLSHTRGLIACAIADGGDVGIDVERVADSADMLDVARHHFSAPEYTELESCHASERAQRFTDLWTLKEAHAKATGAGIAEGFDVPSFTFGPRGSLHVTSADTAGEDWTFAVFGLFDYRLAVAVRNVTRDALTLRISQSVNVRPGHSEARLLRLSSAMPVALVGCGLPAHSTFR